MDATPARSYIPGMDFEPVFSAAADMLRAIPRSELLIAAVAAMVLGWIGAMIAKRSALGGLLRVGSSLALGLIRLTVVLQLSRFDPRFDVAVPQIGLPEQLVEGGETQIPLSADGHFWVRAEVNGVPGNFMIDTGATLTAISAPLAECAGLEPRRGDVEDEIDVGDLRTGHRLASGLFERLMNVVVDRSRDGVQGVGGAHEPHAPVTGPREEAERSQTTDARREDRDAADERAVGEEVVGHGLTTSPRAGSRGVAARRG